MGNLNLASTSLAIEISEQEWLKLAKSGQYPKPRWMLNDSIGDNECKRPLNTPYEFIL